QSIREPRGVVCTGSSRPRTYSVPSVAVTAAHTPGPDWNSRNGSSSAWLVGDCRCPVAASKTPPATVPGLSVPVMLATNTRPDCTDIVLPNGTFSVWARTGVDQSLSL